MLGGEKGRSTTIKLEFESLQEDFSNLATRTLRAETTARDLFKQLANSRDLLRRVLEKYSIADEAIQQIKFEQRQDRVAANKVLEE